MPSSAIVHAAVFTAGALLGGGISVAISSRQRQGQSSPAHVIEVDVKGRTNVSSAVVPRPTELPVLKFGHPGPVSDVLFRKAYVTSYDRRLRHPSWTAEHLTRSSLVNSSEGKNADRANSTFVEDESIPSVFRSNLQDYFRSGYDRGHMVPAADAKASQAAMDETFYLTNIAPQVGEGFNRHYWAYLENWCRQLTTTFQDVYVFTVPLYLPKQDPDGKWRLTHEVIGSPPNVSVPTHFAKVILTTKPSSPQTPNDLEVSSGAFVLPNAVIPDEAPLTSFIVPVEAVERAAGLTLFPEEVKRGSKHICQTTKCEVTVRRFDDTRKKLKSITAPK